MWKALRQRGLSPKEIRAVQAFMKEGYEWQHQHVVPWALHAEGHPFMKAVDDLMPGAIDSLDNAMLLPKHPEGAEFLRQLLGKAKKSSTRFREHRGSHPTYSRDMKNEADRAWRDVESAAAEAEYPRVDDFLSTAEGKEYLRDRWSDLIAFGDKRIANWPTDKLD